MKSGNYWVSRQRYWYQGESAVELAVGGLDYSGCDALYTEDKEMKRLEGGYEDPREAARAALELQKLWQGKTEEKIGLSYGYNLDMIEGEVDKEEEAANILLQWAKAEYERLPKCDRCGEIVVESYTIYEMEEEFCSERCAEFAWEEWERTWEKEVEMMKEGEENEW